MSSCYRTSNNKFASAPARMADGRHFTDYRSSCLTNTRIQVDNKVSNNYELRMFMIRNADNLMELNKKQSYLLNGSFECKNEYSVGTMLPESEKVKCNTQTCDVKHNFEGGIGMGRDYGDNVECLSGLSSPQMTLEQNQCKPMNRVDFNTQQIYDHPVEKHSRVADFDNVVAFSNNNLMNVEEEEQQES